MQLILVGRRDGELYDLEAAFAPGAAAVADGDALVAAGEIEPPPPLSSAFGSILISVSSDPGRSARRDCDFLMDARPDRYAVLCFSDTKEGAEGIAWSSWLESRAGRAARMDAELLWRDPAAFSAWFEDRFAIAAPPVFKSVGSVWRARGPEAVPPGPPLQVDSSAPSHAAKFTARLRARLLERLWLRRHGAAAVRAVRSSPHFDGPWYLTAYPDVADAGVDPALHYLGAGASEGRSPGPHFSPEAWYASRPEARRRKINPLVSQAEKETSVT